MPTWPLLKTSQDSTAILTSATSNNLLTSARSKDRFDHNQGPDLFLGSQSLLRSHFKSVFTDSLVESKSTYQVRQYLVCMKKKMPHKKQVEVESSSSSMEEFIGAVSQLSTSVNQIKIAVSQIQATIARMEIRLSTLENDHRTRQEIYLLIPQIQGNLAQDDLNEWLSRPLKRC